jgi:hypothetical protein
MFPDVEGDYGGPGPLHNGRHERVVLRAPTWGSQAAEFPRFLLVLFLARSHIKDSKPTESLCKQRTAAGEHKQP